MGQEVSKDFESLIEASATGDIKKLQTAIKAGADVNGTVLLEDPLHVRRAIQKHIYTGDTPLFIAILNSVNIKCVRMLIDAGADVNKVSAGHITPLCFAVKRRNNERVKLLIEAGADVNKVCPGNGTPLYVAVNGNNRRCLKMLIEAGADVNNENYQSPLSVATHNVNVECLKILLDAGATPKYVASPLNSNPWMNMRFSLEDKIRCLQLLLSKGAHVNQPGDFWGCALESFLSFLGKSESAMKGVQLIMAAGVHSDSYVHVKQNESSLRHKFRETIRRHLLNINNINLFIRVAQLPLPAALKSYLLYGVTLDEDYVTNDVTDDVECISEELFLPRLEAEVDTYYYIDTYDYDYDYDYE